MLCFFAFQKRLRLPLKHLEVERVPLIPTAMLLVMMLFRQSGRAVCVSAGPTGWCCTTFLTEGIS